ncbi:DUF481 domain-containing protein [Oceanobacter mangrovi]|uniref:DUF481 domain-containing protein n=1 Tax=Oceanobacter mangrovi TaxID=2862510 RepID=UPI001C8E89F6|nr:DUF481 domain-containing protein [Oceanobacter mangrovi]
MKHQVLLVSLLTAAAAAQASDEAPKQPPFWQGFAELGTIATSGNTDTSSLNAKFGAARKGIQWDSNYKLTALTSREDGDASKETYFASMQFDRKLSERSYIAIHAQQERARFSGFVYQSSASVGYGYRLIKNEKHELSLEAGPGYSRNKVEDTNVIEDEGIARLVADYHWNINKGTFFMQNLTAELGQENSTYTSETGLKSQLNGSLATKLTYTVSYVDKVPEGNKTTDTEFGVTLVYSF